MGELTHFRRIAASLAAVLQSSPTDRPAAIAARDAALEALRLKRAAAPPVSSEFVDAMAAVRRGELHTRELPAPRPARGGPG